MKIIKLPNGTISSDQLKTKTLSELQNFGVGKILFDKFVKEGKIEIKKITIKSESVNKVSESTENK